MSNYILEMKNIRKTFLEGKVVANDDVSLRVRKGEKHAIVGENGAGKSTLMKILNGLYQPTSGDIYFHGKKEIINGPGEAARLGIGMVYQHFMLVPTLTVAENMILGVEPKKGLELDINTAREEVKKVSEKYGLAIDPDAKISDLSVGMQQRVEILKILFKGAELLIFDEPTAVLIPQEVKELYKIMDNLIAEGKTIIFITHKLQEVLDIGDNITVIRKGRDVGNLSVKDATKEKIANMMVGRAVLFDVEKPEVELGDDLLVVNNIKVKGNKGGVLALDDVSFTIKAGEVVGIAGVEGNGQSELIDVLTGLRKIEAGTITLEGEPLANITPREATLKGVSHIPEDRLKRAAISQYTLEDNLALGQHQDIYAKGILRAFRDFNKITKKAKEYLEKYDIRPREPKIIFGRMSGGNQQKVIVARELEKNHKFLIAAQPTRGVDIGAIESIHKIILSEKKEGKAIMVVSSELSEILNLSDRIVVMFHGKVMGILDRKDATEEKLGILMAGGKLDEK
ncbi:simple sugar transport system ATP-binding protein [Hypnocyclicus thermotrophus]|uniref:Simple sugar transport system ATP-binding protein n=1 Tax=Hypnocyclicus thermotrophus TaxID=1627895 RepID=A0AA46I6J5_9FUSO|nr:ABC transporter ATP-binding protein [Hypnocyclicus thermotrophus]TDT72461.1 simple sugar transport system ATP-binding protein [Hypnocyclicus thermotrophus]